MLSFIRNLFGSSNERALKRFYKLVPIINSKESKFEKYTDEQLRSCTTYFKEELNSGKSLDDILPDAFAVVREASKRVFSMRHFDVQLVGGMILHNGMVAEMKTGEGKTLTATLPVYLNALSGKGVHIITVNDYLAKRDAAEMGELYEFLGLTTGCIVHGLSDDRRKKEYGCDITYGTNHEFGFDYLRDNMKLHLDRMVQRPFNYAIVDEVDSILIDEARTPLIISGPSEDSSDLYRLVNIAIPLLNDGDYEKDEKQKSVTLTDSGVEKIESFLFEHSILQGNSLYDVQNISIVHHVNAALKAHKMFFKDVDYIVKNEKVIIIDEFTGRLMDGRRYSDGLHQAIEAKENVEIEEENQTLASITYQNLFRIYPKLSGMTGTGMTEASEFEEIYKLNVIQVPTNVPVIRNDEDDDVYLTAQEKYKAVIARIKDCSERKQPVLVGTVSIEKSELLSSLLTKEKISHQVLNARYHEQEAYIIANAGRSGMITIATNMAGRGTDIKLGGNWSIRVKLELSEMEEGPLKDAEIERIKREVELDKKIVIEAGGLAIIGTERHESRRIDDQLRGRSGRQGDPGNSKFFIALTDDLMRLFGSDRLDGMLRKLGAKEGEVISHKWINKVLERAQKKVEARNFDMRKHLLKYDDVMNEQRRVIYSQRNEIMLANDISQLISQVREEVLTKVLKIHMPEDSLPDQWDINGLHAECLRLIARDLPFSSWIQEQSISFHEIARRVTEESEKAIMEKEEKYGREILSSAEKNILLKILDQSWKDHLLTLDHLRQGINLRAYAQNNPLNEYKREAFNLFQNMLFEAKCEFIATIAHFEYKPKPPSFEEFLAKFAAEMDFDSLEENQQLEQEQLKNDEDDLDLLKDDEEEVVFEEKAKRKPRKKKIIEESNEENKIETSIEKTTKKPRTRKKVLESSDE